MMEKTTWIKSLGFIFLGLLLGGATEPCGGSCPTGAIEGPNQTCLFEIVADGRWLPVNGGELKVRMPLKSGSKMGRFAFWFVQDPQKVTDQSLKGRIGHWKLLIRNYEPSESPQNLTISWRLRENPSMLAKGETIRLVVVHSRNLLHGMDILPGSYDKTSHRVQARLQRKQLPYHGIYLVPVRYQPQLAKKMTKPTTKTIASLNINTLH